jgi:2-dehydro-3-deoxyphosphogalactonate aldolase
MSFISNVADFKKAFDRMPLIAILRGARPEEAEAIAGAVCDAGIQILEIPLNSPQPLFSIERVAKLLAGRAIVGAGTVLKPEEVDSVATAGGQLIVSPNFNNSVVQRTKELGLVSAPGVMTPSEAFAALNAGADVLKLFPGEILSKPVIAALAAVLPPQAPLVLVGGVTLEGIGAFARTAIAGFGIGSNLFKPGFDPAEVGSRSRLLVEAMRRAGFGRA